jgi:hypothetical protein
MQNTQGRIDLGGAVRLDLGILTGIHPTAVQFPSGVALLAAAQDPLSTQRDII